MALRMGKTSGSQSDRHRVEREPFTHVKAASVLNAEQAEYLLNALDRTEWRRRKESFAEFDVPEDPTVREELQDRLVQSCASDEVRGWLEEAVGAPLAADVIVDLHRYGPGTGIGVHTDGPVRQARFVLNLNRFWEPSQGGIWVLSARADLKAPVQFIPPLHNTGFGFLTTPASYHALSERQASVAYSVILGFVLGGG